MSQLRPKSLTIAEATCTALDRLTAVQRRDLDNLAASFAMENMPLSQPALEVLAAYCLREISAAECDAQLDALR